MFEMYAATESINTQQDNINYDDNILYLIPRSRFLWAKCNLAKYNLRSRLNCHMRRMFCIALIVSYFDYAALATWYPICIEAHEKKLKNA